MHKYLCIGFFFLAVFSCNSNYYKEKVKLLTNDDFKFWKIYDKPSHIHGNYLFKFYKKNNVAEYYSVGHSGKELYNDEDDIHENKWAMENDTIIIRGFKGHLIKIVSDTILFNFNSDTTLLIAE